MSKTSTNEASEAEQEENQETESESQAPQQSEFADQNQDENDSGVQELTLELALEKLAVAEEAAQTAKDDLLRVQAEMQNLRRRTEQNIEKAHKYGQEKFSTELLSVMDNLERALTSASQHEDESVKAIYDGVDLTLKSFTDCFNKFSIVALDPMGEPFDPQLHQAMSIQENPEVEPNTVIGVMQKGYTLNGRVLRPAMVMVSKAPKSAADEEDA
ncbi:MAG: nucleotide exchange factor GrpE [Gammaproteobacteria bacterium]|nr:nucleotide exchange factor GrpE [Gammaproteobacteria bacterium]|tara:strand:+ start:97 stop:741 length:645 start_codon:yes stop_codon:yes gene_type:complete